MSLRVRSFRIGIYAALIAACAFLTSSAAAKPHVERISFTPRADGEGYVIRFHLDAPVAAYSVPTLRPSGELEMILFNTDLARSYRREDPEGPVREYGENASSGHLTFVFRLDPSRAVSASAYRDRGSNDVLVGLTYSDAPVAARTDAPEPPPIPVRTTAAPAERSSANGSASAEGSRWMLDTVVIDAGHGGRDPGATDHGIREKDVTLAVALKLGRYLQEHLGVDVVYTRKDDRFIELKDRGVIANRHGGKLFVSIHVNAAANAAASGSETYFLGMHKSDAARKTMERENSVVKYERSQNDYADMTEEALIRMSLTQSAYMRKSQELSALIQDQFENRVQRTNRGVKQAGFYVLWGASMPAVLVELGFITNRREAAFLKSEQGQDYMASAIYRAIRTYKEQYEKGLGHASAE